jgi:plastocyanin
VHPARLHIYTLATVAALASVSGQSANLSVQVEDAAGKPLANAIVYAVPAKPLAHGPLRGAVIDQINRQFVPRVSVVQVGTAVEFPNSDNIRHSVYSFSPAKVFTLKLYAGKPASPIFFDKTGLVVLGCNIHDNMVAWLMVVDTPFFAHSDNTGSALLSNLPAGDYSLHVWHEPMSEEPPAQSLQLEAATATPHLTIQVDVAAASPEGVSMPGMVMPGPSAPDTPR